MQNKLDFEIKIREQLGKNAARRMRTTGNIPGVLYGLGETARSISVESKSMTRLLKSPSGRNRILNITVDNEQLPAMVVDWQIDPVSGSLLHVDIQRVDLGKKVHARVPILAMGTAIGVKEEAGLLEQINREVEIDCLPLEVPSMIEVDVSGLHIGDAIRVSHLPLSDDYTYLDRQEQILVHVVAPKVEQEEETEEIELETGEEASETKDSGGGEGNKDEGSDVS